MKKSYKRINYFFDDSWEEEINKLTFYKYNDKDLVNSIKACALTSFDGKDSTLYKTVPDICCRYKKTNVSALVPKINKIIDWFQCEKARIRIFKQLPQHKTSLHTDEENESCLEKHLRVWIPLNFSPNFYYLFGNTKLQLEKGHPIIFDPDYLHGAVNLDKKISRYTLNMVIKPNNWLKEILYEH